jgi:hypothetical protein
VLVFCGLVGLDLMVVQASLPQELLRWLLQTLKFLHLLDLLLSFFLIG